MKHYKNPADNRLYGYFKDGSQDHLIPQDYILLTDAEVQAISNPPPTTAQLTERARAKRDYLLKECDWTQLPDVPLAVQTAWQAYRQTLRDIPEQTGCPSEIVWPDKPV